MLKYTVTFTDRPGSKARYRQALKMMGAESVRIEEAEVTPAAPVKKPDNLPTSEVAKAVAELFGRKPETPWADEEITAFKTAVKSTLLTVENMILVAAHYRKNRGKESAFLRTSLLTFCRHFGTELDKARTNAVKPAGRALEWPDSNKVVKMPLSPEEDERIRAEAKTKLQEFRAQQNERTA